MLNPRQDVQNHRFRSGLPVPVEPFVYLVQASPLPSSHHDDDFPFELTYPCKYRMLNPRQDVQSYRFGSGLPLPPVSNLCIDQTRGWVLGSWCFTMMLSHHLRYQRGLICIDILHRSLLHRCHVNFPHILGSCAGSLIFLYLGFTMEWVYIYHTDSLSLSLSLSLTTRIDLT